MAVRLPIRRVILVLLAIATMIYGLSVMAIATQRHPGPDYLEHTLGRFAQFDDRVSFATWYSSAIFLSSAILLLALTVLSRFNDTPHTHHSSALNGAGVSVLLLVLSIDKSTGLHHSLIHDFLYRMPFSLSIKQWVLKGAIALLLLSVLCYLIPLVRRLTFRQKGLLIFAGLCLLLSEIGLNILVPSAVDLSDNARLFSLLPVFEQLIEHIGGTLLIWALLLHLRSQLGNMKTKI